MGKDNLYKAIRKEQGFTLVDVAIALMVIGLLVAPLAHTYNLHKKEIGRENTLLSINDTRGAIDQFYFNNDRYPCPADPTLNTTNANYGLEDCTGTNPNITVAPVGAGNVFIGAVPFQTLNLNTEQTLDAWSNKVNYAVTQAMTVPQPWAPGTAGLITIQKLNTLVANNQCNVPPVPATVTNVHFALYSAGSSRNGAFNAEGQQAVACPAAGSTLDEENCNNDAVFTHPECIAGEVAGANFYDDLFLMDNDTITNTPTKMWDTGTDPEDVGFGTGSYLGLNNPDPQGELDVIGNIRAESDPTDPTKLGQAQASDYCDPTGTDCFQATLITGNDPSMQCNNNNGMYGIGSSAAKCSDMLPSMTAQGCPSGQYISEITAGGTIVCATP